MLCGSTSLETWAGNCITPIEYQHHIFDRLLEAGEEFGLGQVGMRAMESLRVEKSYRMWGTDLTPEYTLLEAGLDRFARMKKSDFIGKSALERQLSEGLPNRFVTLEVSGVTDADGWGNEPLFLPGGDMVGRATAGVYGHIVQKTLALGYVQSGCADVGSELEIEVLGERKKARVIAESPYDADNKSLRG